MDDLVDGLVGRADGVLLAAVDQVVERVERNRVPRRGVGEGSEHGVGGDAAGVRAQQPKIGAHGVELLHLDIRLVAAVADVVDPSSEGVERCHRLALRRWQEADAVGEVLGLPGGDLPTPGVRVVDLHRRLLPDARATA
jgi:hypothetical protein